MAYDYGYGKLGNKLLELFSSGAPDFQAAEELIKQGADINAIGKDDDENILSEILFSFGADDNPDTQPASSESNGEADRSSGETMCAIIRFFLNHGFDVSKRDGCFGAQCLYNVALSGCDRHMIDATKILLDAGAINRTVSPNSTDTDETPWDFIGGEGSYQDTCIHNHSLGNIYEALFQIYQAVEDGRPYSGIDSYEAALGKKILKVLAKPNGEGPVFYPKDLPEFKKNNCYTATLYFVYDGGVLISTQYADFWTDTLLPQEPLVDVSQHFEGVVGSTIERFAYDHKEIRNGTTGYGQPITTIEMGSGRRARFSINFGEVSEDDRAAYFELL